MQNMKICILWLLAVFLIRGTFSREIDKAERPKRSREFISVITSVPDVLRELYDLWNVLLREPSLDLGSAIFRSKEHEILGRISALNKDVRKLEERVSGQYDTIVLTIMSALPQTVKTELALNELARIIDKVDTAHHEFSDYITAMGVEGLPFANSTMKPVESDADNSVAYSGGIAKRSADKFERDTLLSFAYWAAGHGGDSIKSLLGQMHRITLPENQIRTGLFQLLNKQSKELGSVICNKTTTNMYGSPHQILYNLYNTVALADYKGYVMLQFSYMILKLYEKGDFVAESKRETTKFERRVGEKAEAIRNALSNADRSLYNCDPKTYVEGVNYVKLTKLLQGYIENEVNFNGKQECWDNCAAYRYTDYKGCFKEQFCSKQEPCRGKILECKYMDSDMHICKSSNPERRYDWVAYENGVVLGNKGQCLKRNLFKVDSWWRYLFWHCSYCLCLCDGGNHDSDRYFNLRSVESDISQNKVITGVKIVKHNRIIHLQIQQGVLGPRGVIAKSTISWKPVDNYTITDHHVQNGVDYHTMSWMDRTLDIDDAYGPDEHVLTGVRLRKLGTHLNLEVRVTPINFTTGQVFPEVHSTWISNDNTEVTAPKPRREIHLTNPDIPIRYQGHRINSEHDHFIKFQASSFDHDVAQSTVPFFDSQSVIADGAPLSGIGFIHRGKPGSGGFVAAKLITYNFAPHI